MQAPSTWVLSNHDVTRPVTRYGREDSSFAFLAKRFGTPSDVELGTRRARAAALLTAALPGSLYIYQGDELGLPEVEDIPLGLLQDPMHFRSQGVDPGRDGCRVPLPWSGTKSPFGFSSKHSTGKPWLPQPAEFARLHGRGRGEGPALDARRSTSRPSPIRKADDALGDGPFEWIDLGPDALAFRRGDDFICVTNFADQALELPKGELILASTELVDVENGTASSPPTPRRGYDHSTSRRRNPPHHPQQERQDNEVTTKVLAIVASVAMVASLAACSASGGSDSGKTELRVATFPPGADAAAYEAFAAQEKQFEKENPDIDVIGVEYEWDRPDLRGSARRRKPAGRVHGSVHRRADAAPERSAR